MKQSLSRLTRWVVAGVLAGLGTAALATLLDYPSATSTSANGINNAGQVVGGFSDASGTHGFVYDRGRFTTLDVPGGSFTVASGINNRGWIVGSFGDSNGRPHGFLYKDRRFTTLDVPGGITTSAYGINDTGQVVGTFGYDDSSFLYSNGKFIMLSFPGSFGTRAFGINNAGQIVGSAKEQFNDLYGCDDFIGRANCIPFVSLGGTFSKLDGPGASYLFRTARGINNAGQIVGGSPSFLYAGGRFRPIDVGINLPNIFSEQTNAINDVGQIVGTIEELTDSNGFNTNGHGFLILIPEPGSLVILSVGLLGLGFAWRSKYRDWSLNDSSKNSKSRFMCEVKSCQVG